MTPEISPDMMAKDVMRSAYLWIQESEVMEVSVITEKDHWATVLFIHGEKLKRHMILSPGKELAEEIKDEITLRLNQLEGWARMPAGEWRRLLF